MVAWGYVPSTLLSLFGSGSELELDTVDTVHAVNKENQNKDESNLHPVLNLGDNWVLGNEAVAPVSTVLRVEGKKFVITHVKIFRLTLKGMGKIRSMNSPISKTRSIKT